MTSSIREPYSIFGFGVGPSVGSCVGVRLSTRLLMGKALLLLSFPSDVLCSGACDQYVYSITHVRYT